MIKTTIFNNTNNTNSFHTESTNYSKILDALILADLKKTNKYLNDYEKIENDNLIDGMIYEAKLKNAIMFGKALKDGDLFADAATYLALFGKKTIKHPYIIGHTYFFNNKPIIFHLDSIEIDGTEYYYDDFNNYENLYMPANNKKIIIDIYTKGNTKININI